jgi:REP element-mobilizing transposase RayT
MDEILFRDKYRIPSTRLKTWNYGGSGWYFITICTNGKQPFFGKIRHGTMQLSKMGQIAKQCWAQIPDHFPNVQLDEFVIMPDHVHGIIVIKSPVETHNHASNPITIQSNGNKFGPQSKNLASIIRGFKIGVTQWARTNGSPFFMWQPRYYDHIIRDEDALKEIRQYIRNNPLKYGLTRRDA